MAVGHIALAAPPDAAPDNVGDDHPLQEVLHDGLGPEVVPPWRRRRSDTVVVGSLSVTPRTSGKPSLPCASEGDLSHPVSVLLSAARGRRWRRTVRRTGLAWVNALAQESRDHRAALRALEHLESEQMSNLRGLRDLHEEDYQ